VDHDTIELVLLTERPSVRDDRPSELDLAVEVRCRADGAGRGHAALNLCLVVDRSGSMAGEKLAAAGAVGRDLISRLSGDDRLTVVAFAEGADIVVHPWTRREEVPALLDGIVSGSMSNLSLGWCQGLLEVQAHTTDRHHDHLILVSDGRANAGVTERPALAAIAGRARDAGVTTSTIGIGDDHRGGLLEAIAAASGGRFWTTTDWRAEEVVDAALRGALSVTARRPRIELVLPRGTSTSRELNSLRKASASGYRVRPLRRHDTLAFAVRLRIDPARTPARALELVARLHDGDRLVATGGTKVELVPAADAVRAPVQAPVRSVVRQFELSASGEPSLDLGTGPARRGIDLVVAELVEPYGGVPEVQVFAAHWRRAVASGAPDPDGDVIAGVVAEAIALTHLLAQVDPANAAALERHREALRAHLARLA
jgi:Ca-activated chloride channel family protein